MSVFARFPREPMNDRNNPPEWTRFVWSINDVRPGTFGVPTHEDDTPRAGYLTERYPDARIIWGPADEGIRVCADTAEVAAAFVIAARTLGIHLNLSGTLAA